MWCIHIVELRKNCVIHIYIYIYIYIFFWTLTKCREKNLDGNKRKMLHAVLKDLGRSYTATYIPSLTIQVRRTRHAGHCLRSECEIISDFLLWTFTYRCDSIVRPARAETSALCGYRMQSRRLRSNLYLGRIARESQRR